MLPEPIGIYAILDTGAYPPSGLAEAAREMYLEGIRVFQVRAKDFPSGMFLSLVNEIRQALPSDAVVLVNDRPDIALLVNAHGCHLGDEDIPVEAARKVLDLGKGERKVLGFSTHSIEEVKSVSPQYCDYIGFGPIFESKTKVTKRPTHGISGLEEACRLSPLPVVAIGGIEVDHIEALRRAGASGVAMISGLLRPKEVRERARRAVEAFFRATK